MEAIKQRYLTHFKNWDFIKSLSSSILLLAFSLVVNFYSAIYAMERASNSVTDVVLNNIRVYDVDGIFVYGPVFMFLVVFIILIIKPHRIPFTLKSIGLFILIRSIFTSLTHLAPFPTRAAVSLVGIMGDFTSGGDLFFSGHTGAPFLFALLFWDNAYLRVLFIFLSVLFGTVVLLGHLHYSIDVLSAFFITYTIYHIATAIFPRDKKIFESQN